MARMSIDDRFLRDPRVTRMAAAIGWSKYEARGRLLEVFAIVYDMVQAGREPLLADADIDTAAEWPGLTQSMLEHDLAVRTKRGTVHVRGSKEHTHYLDTRQSSGRAGGIKSGETRRKKAAEKTKVTFAESEGRSNPPDPVPDPASVPDISPDPAPPAQGGYTRERHPDAGGIAHAAWTHANAKANELRAANVNTPPWPLMASGQHSGWMALLDRVGELLVGSGADEARRRAINRVDVAAATARSSGEGHWFTPNRMFSKNSFDTFVDDDPSAIERKPTAATKRGPTDPIRKTNVL